MQNRSLVSFEMIESYHNAYQINRLQPHLIDIKNRYALSRLDKVFKRFLLKNKNHRLLEIGTAPGAWLHYFSSKFQYDCSGIEISLNGCLKTKDNLSILGQKADIICADILKAPFKRGVFDIVISTGLIEHFSNPKDILNRHAKLLKKDGLLIIVVPNYSWFNIAIMKMFSRYDDTFKSAHNFDICKKKNLKKIINNKILKIKHLSYCGIFYPEIYNLNLANMLSNIPSIHSKITKLLNILPCFDNPLLSPFIILIANKKGQI